MLRFNSEEERMQHPQARLIPKPVWDDLFRNKILEEHQLALMQTPSSELEGKLADLDLATFHDFNKKTLWICIALSHSTISNEQLMRIAHDVFAMSPEIILKMAMAFGKIDFFNQVLTTYPEIAGKISSGEFRALLDTAKYGHLDIFEKILSLAPNTNDIKQMLLADDYGVFREAASSGNLAIIERLLRLAADHKISIRDMIIGGRHFKHRAFSLAAANGHLDVLARLLELTPLHDISIKDMIAEKNYFAFRVAAEDGQFAVVEKLLKIAPQHGINIKDMIAAGDYSAFSNAAANGHLAIVGLFIKVAHLEKISLNSLFGGDKYLGFRRALSHHQLAVAERLLDLAADSRNGIDVKSMIAAGDHGMLFGAFSSAASIGNLAFLEKLLKVAVDHGINIKDMLVASGNSAFTEAARGGHLAVMDKLLDLATHHNMNIKDLMMSLNYRHEFQYHPFTQAAGSGQAEAVEKILNVATRCGINIKDMIAADRYAAFSNAAENGHLIIVEKLLSLVPLHGIDIEDMMSRGGNFSAIRGALDNGHLEVANKLLSFSACFAYAELHEAEYARYTHPFLANQITILRGEYEAQTAANPHAVFDIADPERARLCFYMLRNIIRRNDRALDDDLRFLLSIPAVKALAHTAVTPNQPNELVRLALTTGNQAAAEILLNIPAVRILAEQNNYYREEARGGIDLRTLALDRESSMNALTTGEQKKLDAIIKTYQPTLREIGAVDKLMQQLRERLTARYLANPAKIIIDGKERILPVTWKEFNALINALKLNVGDRQKALEAYYQNKDHTALRYLSKPNHWMSEHASYVYVEVNPATREGERWSTFEEYQPLITMLWLAVTDSDRPPPLEDPDPKEHQRKGGQTMEGRLIHFINELALIGRAHNWDRTRIKVDAKGAPMVDESSGKPIEEEYDDLDGDRPSCYSGVKRRLFQSLVGHPLYMTIVKNHIEQELREFIYEHFKAQINNGNRAQLKDAMTTLANEIDIDYAAVAAPLKKLDITPEQQKIFIAYLSKKYGSLFSEDIDFIKFVNESLSLSTGPLDESVNSHFSKFYVFANLQGLLDTPEQNAQLKLLKNILKEFTATEKVMSEKAQSLSETLKAYAPLLPKFGLTEEQQLLFINAIAHFDILAEDRSPFHEVNEENLSSISSIAKIIAAVDARMGSSDANSSFKKRAHSMIWLTLNSSELRDIMAKMKMMDMKFDGDLVSATQRLSKFHLFAGELDKALKLSPGTIPDDARASMDNLLLRAKGIAEMANELLISKTKGEKPPLRLCHENFINNIISKLVTELLQKEPKKEYTQFMKKISADIIEEQKIEKKDKKAVKVVFTSSFWGQKSVDTKPAGKSEPPPDLKKK